MTKSTGFQKTGTTLFRIGMLSLAGCALLAAGCRIPGLRGPEPGAALPAAYALNNGRPFWAPANQSLPGKADDSTPEVDDQQPAAEPRITPDESAQADSPSGFVRPASFTDRTSSAYYAGDRDAEAKLETNIYQAGSQSSSTSASANQPFVSSDNIETTVDAQPSLDLETPANFLQSDPFLAGLVQEALVGNQELKILFEEIQIACNEAYARSGEYRPFVTLGTGMGVEKSGRHTRNGAVEEQLEVTPGGDFPDPLPDFLVAANVSWEVDIWNRLRNAQRAATMRYLGSQEGRNYVVTRLVAEVAENYYELLALDNRSATLQRTIEIQQQSMQVAQANKDAGRGTELAVQRFKAEVRKNEAEQSVIVQEITEVENRINFLLGRYPQPIARPQVEFVDLDCVGFAAGVPSELLLQRADIRQAEREVQAAGLDVLAARARFYPNLSLNAGLGWNAFSTGYLFRTPESLIYGLAGELVGPLINRRAIKAAYQTANAAQLQAIYDYQKTILTAHIEVVNYLTKVENYSASIDSKRKQLEALQASVEVATKLFQNARAEYVEVLLAQREMMEARMQLIEIKREQFSAMIRSYQALGGGAF